MSNLYINLARQIISFGKTLDKTKDFETYKSMYRLCDLYQATSYLYYKKDESLISDETYDLLAKELLKRYNEIPNNYEIDKNSLKAGTGYALKYSDIQIIIFDFIYKIITYKPEKGALF